MSNHILEHSFFPTFSSMAFMWSKNVHHNRVKNERRFSSRNLPVPFVLGVVTASLSGKRRQASREVMVDPVERLILETPNFSPALATCVSNSSLSPSSATRRFRRVLPTMISFDTSGLSLLRSSQ